MTKTCLDCLHCKVKFPVNKRYPLNTSLVLYPKRINGKKAIYRSMVCKKGRWVNPNLKQMSIPHSEQNIKNAREGNSRYLNQAGECIFFEDMEG